MSTFFRVAMILSVCDKEGLDGDTTSWDRAIVVARRREGRGRKGKEGEKMKMMEGFRRQIRKPVFEKGLTHWTRNVEG